MVVNGGDVCGDGEVPGGDGTWEASRAAGAASGAGRGSHRAGDASRQTWDVGVSPEGAGHAGG